MKFIWYWASFSAIMLIVLGAVLMVRGYLLHAHDTGLLMIVIGLGNIASMVVAGWLMAEARSRRA